jgi:hypothetical protein
MDKRLIVLLASPAALFLASFGCPSSITLPVPEVEQEGTSLCWAAGGEMVMKYIDKSFSVPQCQQVHDQYGSNCCTPDKKLSQDKVCDITGNPMLAPYGFDAKEKSFGDKLTWEQLKEEIGCKSRPILVVWNFRFSGGHVVVVNGYKSPTMVKRDILITDPLKTTVSGVKAQIYYKRFEVYETHHLHTYYEIKQAGG